MVEEERGGGGCELEFMLGGGRVAELCELAVVVVVATGAAGPPFA